MQKVTLYSSSRRTRPTATPSGSTPNDSVGPSGGGSRPAAAVPSSPGGPKTVFWRRLSARLRSPWVVTVLALAALFLVLTQAAIGPAFRAPTQEDIDAAVLHTLATKPLPSRAAKAYEIVQPSVVRVRGMVYDAAATEYKEASTGTGVVIVANGMILTNLHVVAGAERVRVVFANGLESDAAVVGLRPEHDLAVIRATTLPDDVVPATLRSTQNLALGDDVIAVGFPFGLGPSVSAGVVSGLRRQYYSDRGERLLTNLIQFDAAANPGSSGGPLVTSDGEVVGIVTSILNPTEESFFIGIGFAVPIENAAAAVGIPPF